MRKILKQIRIDSFELIYFWYMWSCCPKKSFKIESCKRISRKMPQLTFLAGFKRLRTEYQRLCVYMIVLMPVCNASI